MPKRLPGFQIIEGLVPEEMIQRARELRAAKLSGKRYLVKSREMMARAKTTRYCTVCGTTIHADFAPQAFDDLAQRKQWQRWHFVKKCESCKTAGNKAGQAKYCVHCGAVFNRTQEDNQGWAGRVTCGCSK